MERVSTGKLTEAIRVSTRQRQREFSMFLSLDESFGVISQLADIALRRLLDSEGLELDRVLQQPARITKRSAMQLLFKLFHLSHFKSVLQIIPNLTSFSLKSLLEIFCY